ncbi:alpha/beta hydrolase family esterase [Streptomyces sp. NPDC051561]|uniref:alpha/beta hydrolase family esterase n=1 Tax=Streptomyces sp. NPDC051561 TaxID=3365658 RepID=UPI0037987516
MPTRPGKALTRTLGPLLAAALLVAATGCGGDADKSPPAKQPSTPTATPAPPEVPRPGDQRVTLTWKGKQRTYAVHAPPGFTAGQQLPVVVAMHMFPGTADAIANLSDLDKKADAKNFLAVYPEGFSGGFNALTCCGAEDDIGFLRLVLDRITTTWKADPNRIYATGISNGADMSFKVAVELHDRFAAVAPVSGAFAGSDPATPAYAPKSPVSVMTFIGGKDDVQGPAEEGVTYWQDRLSCKPSKPQKLRNSITRTAAKCRDNSDFVAYRIPEMGHAWPGGAGGMGDPEAGVSATDLMWDFFAAHSKKKP